MLGREGRGQQQQPKKPELSAQQKAANAFSMDEQAQGTNTLAQVRNTNNQNNNQANQDNNQVNQDNNQVMQGNNEQANIANNA